MKINQVLDIFQNPSTPIGKKASDVWMLVKDQNNRNGYLCLDFEKYPTFAELSGISMPTEEERARAAELLQGDDTIQDFSQRPRIEDASPAMRALFDEMENADAITYFVHEENCDWEDIGLTREEYENQIDADIKKFGLDGIVCKYNDEEALYTCYGNFLCSFSKSGGKEAASSLKDDDMKLISEVLADGGKPAVAVSFVPIDFQRNEEYPFRICEIMDRRGQGNPCVSYIVVRDGKEEAIFTGRGGDDKRNYAYFSALDYIAGVYHDSPDLAQEHFDGVAYTRKYYEIALLSNPSTRLKYNPMALDAHWRQLIPVYSASKVFGDAMINGELSASIMEEIKSKCKAISGKTDFHFDAALVSKLDSLPPIGKVFQPDSGSAVTRTPIYAAAQYEWEKERTKKILDETEKKLLSYLFALDAAMEKHGPTRASLDYFYEMLNDLCYGKEEKLKDMGVPANALLGPFKNMETAYMTCHKVLKAFESAFAQDDGMAR